ncbi:hypothetical protein F511_39966 [Dorcoceras hygrometricum]|uniref:Uncharacterized protein n=1 Tax=Dorcoceras hygrometricum TaxID=472368 RepID=A0A2Z7D0Q0_9LAMI|nr:hypothetical protein F511_39966 [Dorcoceras hygrometricum]
MRTDQIGASSSERHARRLLYHQLRSQINTLFSQIWYAQLLTLVEQIRPTSWYIQISSQYILHSTSVKSGIRKTTSINSTQPTSTLVTQNDVALPPNLDTQFLLKSGILLSLSLQLEVPVFETGVARFEEREVVVVLESLRDCGPVVLLFFESFGFELIARYFDRLELVVASVELLLSFLGSILELVAVPSVV